MLIWAYGEPMRLCLSAITVMARGSEVGTSRKYGIERRNVARVRCGVKRSQDQIENEEVSIAA